MIAAHDLRDILAEPPPKKFSKDERDDWATKVIRWLEQRSGLLQSQGNHPFSIAFKLQEFMAAAHLVAPGALRFTHGNEATFEKPPRNSSPPTPGIGRRSSGSPPASARM